MPKIIHYRENCIGCNSCVEHAGQYWEMDDDGKARLKGSIEKKGVYQKDIVEVEIDCNVCAAQDCPVNIIRVQDDSGRDITHQ